MDPQTFEGTWEEVGLQHGSELAGRKVRVIVLDVPSLSEAADSDGLWIKILRCFSLCWLALACLVAGTNIFGSRSYTSDPTSILFMLLFLLVGVVGMFASISDSTLERRIAAVEKRQTK